MQANSKRLTRIALAASALLLTAPLTLMAGDMEGGHCNGANACKGHSACKTANNGCKGQNACKGQGFVMTANEEECTKLGGTFEAPPAPEAKKD